MWSELADRDPSLLEHFERFLSGVTAELKQSQHDKEKLETHMRRCVYSVCCVVLLDSVAVDTVRS